VKRLLLISLVAIMCLVGKEALGVEKCFLPDFSFLKENDFDPRNVFGERPRNFQEAKNNLRQIFYTGLADALKNHQLPIVVETLKKIEKVLALASKVFGLPLTTYHLPLPAVILPTLKDYLKKIFSTINRAATISTISPFHHSTISLFHYLTISLFSLSLLSLSTIILRL